MTTSPASTVKPIATISAPGESIDTSSAGIVEIEKLPTPVEHVGATSVAAIAALIVADFVTGGAPSTVAKLAALTEFAEAHYDGREAEGLPNPALVVFEALGRGFSETSQFSARYGMQSETDFITLVYKAAFGTDATIAQQAHFENQLAYFESMYEAAEISEAKAEIWAKGAVLGQMLGISALEGAPANAYLSQAENFLIDAADGTVAYGKPLFLWDAM